MIDIAGNKCIRIGPIQSDQHLLKRDTGRHGLGGNLPQRVAFFDFVGSFGLRRRRSGHGTNLGRTRLDWAGGNGRGRGERPRYRCCRRGRLGDWLHALVLRRIKQEGVFAHQPAGIPRQLHQHIEEGLPYGRVGRQLDDRLSITPIDREANAQQDRIEIDTSLPVGFGRGKSGGKRFLLARLDGNDLDLRR